MSETDLGGGSRLVLNDLSGYANLPAIKAAIEAKAQQAASYANSIAVTDPGDEGELYYVRTRDQTVGVMPNSFRGVVDDSYHSTLLKVLAHEQGA